MAGQDALQRFHSGLAELSKTADEALDSHSSLSPETRSSIVELAALRAASLFEELTKSILTLSLMEDPSVPSEGALLPARDDDDLRILLRTQGASSRDWISFTKVQEMLAVADNYLKPGHAFDRIRYRNDDRQAIEDLRILRNAVAHPSEAAEREFRQLAARKRYQAARPAAYLLSKSSGVEEVRLLLARIRDIGTGLLERDPGKLENYFQPERSISGVEKAAAGDYECASCGNARMLANAGKLGTCDACPPPTPCSHCGNVSKRETLWRHL